MWETLTITGFEDKERVKENVIESLAVTDEEITDVKEVIFIQKNDISEDKKYFIVDINNPFPVLGHEYTNFEWVRPREAGKYKTVPGLIKDLEKIKNY